MGVAVDVVEVEEVTVEVAATVVVVVAVIASRITLAEKAKRVDTNKTTKERTKAMVVKISQVVTIRVAAVVDVDHAEDVPSHDEDVAMAEPPIP